MRQILQHMEEVHEREGEIKAEQMGQINRLNVCKTVFAWMHVHACCEHFPVGHAFTFLRVQCVPIVTASEVTPGQGVL